MPHYRFFGGPRFNPGSYFVFSYHFILGFPGGSAGKESACNVGDLGSIPGLGRSSGEENGCPLQYSGLENFMDYSMGSERVRHG